MILNKEMRIAIRNNPITLRLAYVLKCEVGYKLKYYIEKIRISMGIVKSKKMADKLGMLKNIHSGEKCVIIGNGPSLRLEDLERLKTLGIDTFATNRIVDLFDYTKWRPNYLCIMDPGFLIGHSSVSTSNEYLKSVEKEKFKIILNDIMLPYLSRGYKEGENIYFVACNVAELFSTRIFPFSENIPLYVSDMGSVTHFCIQLACYMGYNEIYLYGMDNTYIKYLDDDGVFKINPGVESHAKGMKKNTDDNVTETIPKSKFEAYKVGGFADIRKNNCGYKICKDYAEKNNVKIYNITRGGKLEIFERKNFDDVFKE